MKLIWADRIAIAVFLILAAIMGIGLATSHAPLSDADAVQGAAVLFGWSAAALFAGRLIDFVATGRVRH